MSLIQTIKSRQVADCINEGSKMAFTGTVTNSVTDSVIYAFPSNRAFAVTGLCVSTSSTSSIQVSLGIRVGSTTTSFFTGFVVAGGNFERVFETGDWYRSPLGASLVITTSGTGITAYTVDTRVTADSAAVNYVSHEGAIDHPGRAVLPPESGQDRGQMRV